MGLPRTHRLTRHADFQRLYDEGRKFVHRLAVFFVLPSAGGVPRVGLTVSRRIGKAVRRNRIKRRLREAWRRRLDELPAVDVVVVARAGLAEARFSQIEEAVSRFLSWLRPKKT
jgi:ribonuclease P protein component